MTDGRPEELTEHQADTSTKNDTLIINALGLLEDPTRRGKRKATVAAICQLTGLSRNTIRNRQWACDRIKTLKRKLKAGAVTPAAAESTSEQTAEPTLDDLRKRIRRILEQNALLYEEILSLQSTIAKKDSEIAALKARNNFSIVPPTGRETE
ncbi:hypothetical protein [Burkholderia cepacia]|uniref:hypothetical protein n=1 Tax=Burkholderia cepacia TaxID=292 RepID=UPI000F573D0A|nr:hypothetical protein [Burkholderia cepacia]RQT81347.1 hypothetical protein DF023_22485 [Burkholderia cepacia]RQU00700.1 hypothetical protein DF022_22865 [Burkholderia cepacia]